MQSRKTIPGHLFPQSLPVLPVSTTPSSLDQRMGPHQSFSRFQLLLKPSTSSAMETVAFLTPVKGVDISVQVEEQQLGEATAIGGFNCPTCGSKKKDAAHLRDHIVSMHSDQQGPFECPRFWCTEAFSTQWERNQHKEGCKLFCKEPGCPKADIGMVWARQVQQHKNKHLTYSRKMAQLEE